MTDTPIADDSGQHQAAISLLDALHRAGFSTVWMEDVKYFTGGLREGKLPREEIAHHHLRLVLDDSEITPQRFETVLALAAEHNATVGLTEIRFHQDYVSRLTLWPH